MVFYKQPDQMDCGPTCLRMVAKHYGRNFSLQHLRGLSGINREGVSMLGISEAAEQLGFRSLGVQLTLAQLKEAELPAILHWQQNHFVMLYSVKKNRYTIADPAKGMMNYKEKEFSRHWLSDSEQQHGVALLLSPSPVFYEQEDEKERKISWGHILRYLVTYRQLLLQLLLGLGVGSLLQLIAPFLTQSIVDIGINTRNLNFIHIILVAQLTLFIGRISVEFIRSWILLHVSTRINISILTDFLIKLMKLPMQFFDTKMTGDIMQRMNDQRRIESFLTGPVLSSSFSLVNLLLFSIVLAWYNTGIFFVFAASSVLYGLWIVIFLRQRRNLDYKRFDISAKNQSNLVQMVTGMQEIKLNNCEQQKRWEWEHLQARLFRFNIKSLTLTQYQQAGSLFINEGKNILITFFSAKAVIEGDMTLGAMMAVQYAIGQLNSPIEQLLGFIQGLQDARISLERLNEIHEMHDEEPTGKEWSHQLPGDKSLHLKNLTFRYPGAGNEPVIQDIDLHIPEGKTTAIVGMSGSGKTTILKLLLRFYEPEKGQIEVGNGKLSQISFRHWRSCCGVVMQDGFIFSDSIARNIAVGDERPERNKLLHAIKTANLDEFIESLPLGLNTMIGAEGNGISQGQRQRILIARAVYKNPEYLFFDEATNSLDANNERVIINNLKEFFRGKTVVVVAHRLSTVRHADNIVVLDKGRIVEQGNHEKLTCEKGKYYQLVKNQLELGA